MNSDIIIVGGGYAGVTSALALKKTGFNNITLVEKNNNISEHGYGINIMPPAVSVLSKLGVLDKIKSVATRIKFLNFWTQNPHKKGKLLFRNNIYKFQRHSHYTIHRGDLIKILYNDLIKMYPNVISLATECINVECHAGLATLTLHKKNQDKIVKMNANLVICADGIHSKLRYEHFTKDTMIKDVGFQAWRSLIDVDKKKFSDLDSIFANTVNCIVGPDCVVFTYLISNESKINVLLLTPSDQILNRIINVSQDDFLEHAKAISGLPDFFYKILKGKLSNSAIFPVRNTSCFSPHYKDCLLLIGDASHAIDPILGYGANLAIIDAWMLKQNLLVNNSIPEALRAFDLTQRPFSNKVVSFSNNGRKFLMKKRGIDAMIRNAMLLISAKNRYFFNKAMWYYNYLVDGIDK